MKISPALSSYLDGVRFVAALAVLFGHLSQDGFAMDWMPLAKFSHSAVIVFFVLSGFIVYSSTVTAGIDGRRYFVARASRIYSVALPSVLFCSALALLVELYAPEFGRSISGYRPISLADITASLLFLNQSWMMTTDLPFNDPYWSLCYEVWYYAFFGIFIFLRSRWRFWWLILAFSIAGPAIVVLFPIWCLGAWLASQYSILPRLSRRAAWLLYMGSIAAVVAIEVIGLDHEVKSQLQRYVRGFWILGASQRVATDYLLGAVIAVHIYAFSSLHAGYQDFIFRMRPILFRLAGFSFTLYLFHRPFSLVLSKLFSLPNDSAALAAGWATVILSTCWLISFGTERQLRWWRSQIDAALKLPACRRTQPKVLDGH